MKYIMYTNTSEYGDGKMYFVDTKWGGPSYCNNKKEAWIFDTLKEAQEAKEIFEEDLVVFEEHTIEEYDDHIN